MEIQWYPGHMTKAIRQMREDMKLIDLVIEIVDARVPLSSRNPMIDDLAAGKARVLLLNKRDLADESITREWIAYFKEQDIFAVGIDARDRKTLNELNSVIEEACAKKRERDLKRGIKNRPIRAMVVGIPNCGKSTFINSYAGKKSAKTGNKPGVTKGKQWIRLRKDLELLDTPGILWPKFEDEAVGVRLASIGSVKDDILNTEELCYRVISFLRENYSGRLAERYDISEEGEPYEVLAAMTVSRNLKKAQGEPDTERGIKLLLDDFRGGALGRVTLERP